MGNGERNILPRPFSSVTLWERPKPRALAPSPAKAGEGWGGVPFGSARTMATPSQSPPVVAGEGAGPAPNPALASTMICIHPAHALHCPACRSDEHTSELQ